MTFKVGDRVKVLSSTYLGGSAHSFTQWSVGKLGEVIQIRENDTYPIKVQVDGGEEYGEPQVWYLEENLKLVSKELSDVEVGDVLYNPVTKNTIRVTGVELKIGTDSGVSYTLPYMKEKGFTFGEPKQQEVTLQDIADKFGIRVEELRIKE